MRAWQVNELGNPAQVLRPVDVASPEPGPGEVRLDVAAASLNFPDQLMCRGEYQIRHELPFTPGSEVAGTVSALGEGVTGFALGDRVLGLPSWGHGSYAEQTLAPVGTLYPVPDDMDWTHAASLYVTYQTSHIGLFHRGHLREGETLLVHAGAGGVGSAAIQLGLAAGARVFATAGGAEKVQVCRDLGAELAIDYRAEEFLPIVKEATDGAGVDVVYDPVGGDVFDASRRVLAWEGRLLVVGFTSGRFPEAPANYLLIKNIAVIGVNWGMYNLHDPALVRSVHDDLLDMYANGRIEPLVSEEIRGDEVGAGLERLGSRGTWGKVVWRP